MTSEKAPPKSITEYINAAPKGNVISDGIVEHIYMIEDGLIKAMEIKNLE